jgi:Domain of unknown function (DUF4115)
MNKSCLHCHQKLGFLQAVRGELFCSSDHREAYFQAEVALAFERVTSFDKPASPAPAAVEPPQPVLEIEPAPVAAVAAPVSAPEVKPEAKPEAAPEVSQEALPVMLREAPEPVPFHQARKEEAPPAPVAAPEPAPVLEIKDEPKEEVAPALPVASVVAPEPVAEPIRVPEAKEEVPPIPVVIPEPPSVPEAKEEIKEEVAPAPVMALDPPKLPEVKEPAPIRVAPEAGQLIKIPAPKAGPKRPKWVAPGIAACLALVALGAIFFGPSKKTERSLLPNATPPLAAAEKPVPVPVPTPEPAPAPPPPAQAVAPVAAPVVTPAPAPKPAAPPVPVPVKPAPAPAPVVAANPAGAHHAASITVKATAWVAVCSDGTEVLATMMSPGEERKIDFTGKAIVRTGNAGGIAIVMDGKSVGPVGPPGGLRVVELNPQVNPHGFHLLSLKPGDNGACVSN